MKKHNFNQRPIHNTEKTKNSAVAMEINITAWHDITWEQEVYIRN